MRFSCLACSILLAVTSIHASALTAKKKNQITVIVEPENKALKENIENFVGSYEDQDRRTLYRLQRVVKQQASDASQALGYYDLTITTKVIRKDDPPTLEIKVKYGEPVRLNKLVITIEGEAATTESFTKPNNKQLRPRAILNHGVYDKAKSHIQQQALRYGFFFGKFTAHQLLINPPLKTADINIAYNSGPRSKLGAVTFTGEKNPFDVSLLNRFVNFEPGTPYDAELLAKLNSNLQSSGYFESVRLDAIPIDEQHLEIPVTAEISPTKPRVVETSAGYATDIGPRAKFSWKRPWINRYGHQLGFETEVSGKRQNASAWYQIPKEDPLTDYLRFIGGIQREDIVDTKSTLATLGVERTKMLDNDWLRTFSLRFQNENYKVGDIEASRMFLMPGISYSYLRADNSFDPNHGYRLQFDLSGAKAGVLSDADFIRYNASAKGLYTFERRHRLLARINVAGIEASRYPMISPSLRFYAGGDQSVRGYAYQVLSPEDSKGKKVGGRYMIAGSGEYQYAFAEKWRAAIFYDKGNAMDSWSDALKTGVGVGIRWVSPIGPIRVDLARGIEDKTFRVHFTMGSEL